MRRAALALAVLTPVLACQQADATPPDVANATYTIDHRSVTLSNELYEEPAAPGSAAKATTRLLNARAFGDLNGDDRQDAVVILTHSPGGSGTFYYVAGVLGSSKGGTATPAVLLGDRISIEAVGIASARITVRLLERNQGEPFAAAPTVRVTRIFEVKAGALSEVK